MNDLQEYISGLFSAFSTNRQKAIEPSWTDARNTFNRIIDTSKNSKKGEGENWRSTAFLGTTKQKVVAAAAILTDTMLQGGRINYLLNISPESREALEEAGFPEDFYEDNKEKMQALIDTQLSWAKADTQMRKGILSGAIYGDAYAKIVHDEHTKAYFRQIQETVLAEATDALRFEFQKETVVFPKWTHLNVWDCFTDLEDPDPRTNLGFFHRSFVRKADLKKLLRRNESGILKDNLRTVIRASDESTPDTSSTANPKLDDINTTFHNLRQLDFYGRASVSAVRKFLTDKAPELLADFDLPEEDDDEESEEIDIHLLLAGFENTIIRISPIDEILGRPIFHVAWEDDSDDSVKSTGVADNCMNTQHLQNTTFRSLIDNQALSGNALIGIKEEFLMEPLNDVTPGKKIRITPDCVDVRQAVQNFQIQDVSPGILRTLDVISQMLEEDSNIPRIQQGVESSREETAFSMAQRLEKSGKYFGQVVRNYDDGFVEQGVQYMYYYNMLDPDVSVGKGDYGVQALGFSSFQDRVVRLNGLRQFFEIALSHPDIFERLKLENLFREFARMLDLDPDQVTYNEEEIAEREARAAEEAQRQAELAALEMQQKQAAIARDNSQATINTVHANKANEELKMAQMKAVQETQTNTNNE